MASGLTTSVWRMGCERFHMEPLQNSTFVRYAVISEIINWKTAPMSAETSS